MKFILKYNNIEFELTYNKFGTLEHVKNLNTGKYILLEHRFEGKGYKIQEEQYMIGEPGLTCQAKYIYAIDYGFFVPYFIFINKK